MAQSRRGGGHLYSQRTRFRSRPKVGDTAARAEGKPVDVKARMPGMWG
jgi:hypothetical protein